MEINGNVNQKAIQDRLSEYIEYDALMAPAAFASKAGLDPSGFSKMLKGQLTITKKTLKRIAETYGLNLEWLLYGTGKAKDENYQANNNVMYETRPRIPMTVAAGTLSGFADSVKSYDCEQIPVVKAFPKYDYTIIIKGDSMEPKFEGGDEIAINKVNDVIEWGKTYVLDTRDGAVLKRLYDAGQKYRCVSYNKEYPDFEIDKNDVFGVYKVVGLIRIGL